MTVYPENMFMYLNSIIQFCSKVSMTVQGELCSIHHMRMRLPPAAHNFLDSFSPCSVNADARQQDRV